MAMAGRHIRHDWQHFIPHEQKSVRTLCNKTSTWNATGIPGITEQPDIVEVGKKKVFGWCTMCSVSAYTDASTVLRRDMVHPYMVVMYNVVLDTTRPVYEAYKIRMEASRQRDRRRLQ